MKPALSGRVLSPSPSQIQEAERTLAGLSRVISWLNFSPLDDRGGVISDTLRDAEVQLVQLVQQWRQDGEVCRLRDDLFRLGYTLDAVKDPAQTARLLIEQFGWRRDETLSVTREGEDQ